MPFYESRDRTLEISRIENFTYPLHLHREVELIYAAKGRLHLHVDGEAYLLEEGDIAAAFPNVVHGYLPLQGGGGKGMFLSFPPDLSQDYGADLTARRPVCPVLRREAIHPETPILLKYALTEAETSQDVAVIKAYMALVLARIMPSLDLSDSSEHSMPGRLYRILAYLAEHCTEQITLNTVAKEFGLSASYISHLFSDTIRVNFRAYLNMLRLRRAIVLLWSTDAPITRICYDCGFESQRTFNRVFRERYGITPSAYRAGAGKPASATYRGNHAFDSLPAIQAVPSLRVKV
ncbi:MAG: AraC family transcriptional regulator [Christensenellales bacterium]|jgi:AraC-like DNA-binding protein